MNADSIEVQQDGLLLELLQYWLLYLWLLWHLAQPYFPVALEQEECNRRLQINPRRVVLDITLQQRVGMNLWKVRKKLLLAPVQALSKSRTQMSLLAERQVLKTHLQLYNRV